MINIPSIHKWIHENNFVNEKKNQINFKNHFFLFDIYSDFSKEIVIKKSAQVGVSTTMIFKKLHLAKNLGVSTIYTLPSESDIWEFVPTKVDKIIMANSAIRKLLTKNSATLKEIGGSFIYYKGTISKTAPIMTTADLLIHDELDRSDQKIINQFKSRTIGYKGETPSFTGKWTLSNPSVVNNGIDFEWKKSDQKEWMITCPKCKLEQMLRWDRNVDFTKGEYVCAECSMILSKKDRKLGRWVAKNPGVQVSGYHISQLMASWLTAKDLIKQQDEMDADTFANFVLGEPASMGDVEDFRRLILDCWTPKELDKPPYILGIDVGRVKHWVLGSSEGIFKIGKCESREELEGIIERYNPLVVMDAGPERTWAEEFRRKYPKFWINFYKRDKDRKKMVHWGEKKEAGIVYSDRNRVIDATINDIACGEILYDLDAATLNQYIKHWEVLVRKKELDAQGMERFVWDKNMEHAPDHWVHATVYYWIGRSRAKDISFIGSQGRKKAKFIESTGTGFKMKDLEEYLKEQHEN